MKCGALVNLCAANVQDEPPLKKPSMLVAPSSSWALVTPW